MLGWYYRSGIVESQNLKIILFCQLDILLYVYHRITTEIDILIQCSETFPLKKET